MSHQVNWWVVHEYVAPLLETVGSWPMAGTPEWCALEDRSVKLAAIYDAAQHWALRIETCQEARAAASHAVAGALNWAEVSREILVRTDFYASRPWLKRATS